MNGAGPLTAASPTTSTTTAAVVKEAEVTDGKESSPSLSQQTSIEVTNEFLSKSKSKENVANLESQTKRISSSLQCEPEVKIRDDVTNVHVDDEREPLVGTDDDCHSPNLNPISRRDTVPTSVYVAMSSSPCPRSPYTEEEEDEEEEEEEEENLSLTSPGTPCSQCLRDEEELATSQRHRSMTTTSSSGVGGKMKFCNGDHVDTEQQSSEECYSVESGSLCCNSSCCDERHLVSKKSAESSSRGKRLSSEEAVAKLGQKPVTGCDGGESGDVSSRQLVTYVTPGMETVPLEMCQDIPDVLI